MRVRVSYRTSLSDLALLLREYAAVTLATHCRLMPFQTEDILDPLGFERVIRSRVPHDDLECQVLRALNEAIEKARQSLFAERDPRQCVTAGLNSLVSRAHAWYERDMAERAPAGDTVGAISHRLTRAELEYRFPEFLAAGRCVELGDGLCTIPALAKAIPEGFTGILDLSLCNSAILERSIKTARPKCLLVINQGLAAIDARIIRYKLIALKLSQSSMCFVDALREVHLALKGAGQ
jgi:hypothetical protein